MRHRDVAIFGGWLLIAVLGCSGSGGDSPAPESPASDAAASTTSATTAPETNVVRGDTSKPEAAVQVFLEAVRSGDDGQAGAMFTSLARQKIDELDLQVAPPGTDTARFTVGEAQPGRR